MKTFKLFITAVVLSVFFNCSKNHESLLSLLPVLANSSAQNLITDPVQNPGINPVTPGQNSISIKMEGKSQNFTISASIASPQDKDIYIDVSQNSATTGVLNDDYQITQNPIVITAGNTTASATITVNPARDVSIDREFDFDIQDGGENDYDKDHKCRMKIKGALFNSVDCDATDVKDPNQTDPSTYTYSFANLYSDISNIEAPGMGIDVPGMTSPYATAISPDGKNVYLTALNNASGRIFVFTRDTGTGALTLLETFRKDTGAGTSHDIPGLMYPYEIIVSPDGKNVYAIASDDFNKIDSKDIIYVFNRNAADGSLTLAESFSDTGITLGTEVSTLSYLINIDISPDGKFLYAVATGDRAINVFSRDTADGTLTFIRAYLDITKDAVNGIDGMDSPNTIKIFPDGKHALLAAGSFLGGDHGCFHYFNRDTVTGLLTVNKIFCSSKDTVNTAKSGITTLDAIYYPHDIAIAPNNQFVYISDIYNGKLHTFNQDSAADTLTYSSTIDAFPYEFVNGNWLAISADGSTLISGMIPLNIFSVDSSSGNLTGTHTFSDFAIVYLLNTPIFGKYVAGLLTPMNMVFSPDGSSIYSPGFYNHSLVHLRK